MSLGLRLGFLSIGVMAASLSEWGTEPEVREELMICVMRGEMAGRQSLTKLDGMGSKTQVEVLMPDVKVVSSVGDTGEK